MAQVMGKGECPTFTVTLNSLTGKVPCALIAERWEAGIFASFLFNLLGVGALAFSTRIQQGSLTLLNTV